MKMTKLSLVAALAVSAAFAGGDIAPVEPVVVAAVVDCNKDTTIAGKLQGYYITTDATDDMFGDHHQLGAAATLDVAHKLFDNVTLNFGAVGYINAFDQSNQTDVFDNGNGYFENNKKGAFFNVANLTATYADTTFILGRQLIDTPLVGGFDWLLAPGAFEAAVIANKSIENVTLVAGYLTKWRANNTGSTWINLTDIDDGNNYTVGAIYGADALKVSAWYYNVDSGAAAGNVDKFKAIYGDAGYDFGSVNVAGQIISTDFDTDKDGLAYGLKVGTEFSGVNLTAAVSNTSDNQAGFVGRDSMYTSSWNTFASHIAVLNDDTLSWKVGASTEYAGINAEASYAGYGDDGSEFDLILGYDVTDSVNFGAIYTNTTANVKNANDVNALEVIATYKF
jgi:hypothetical protein